MTLSESAGAEKAASQILALDRSVAVVPVGFEKDIS
jgi:hypothetical protein